MRTPEISGPRPLTKLQPDGGIAGPLHRVVSCRMRDEEESKENFAAEAEYVAELEKRAKEAVLQAKVLIGMRDEACKNMVERRIYDIAGDFPSRSKPVECVFHFAEGDEEVRIEDVRLPWRYGGGEALHFRSPVVVYRSKLKSGNWSKTVAEVDAMWAITQIEKHTS